MIELIKQIAADLNLTIKHWAHWEGSNQIILVNRRTDWIRMLVSDSQIEFTGAHCAATGETYGYMNEIQKIHYYSDQLIEELPRIILDSFVELDKIGATKIWSDRWN